ELQELRSRTECAERRLLACENLVGELGSSLATLGTLLQGYGQLQQRLLNLENLLKNRNFWILRLPPDSRGEIPKVPLTFDDISVYFNELEWKRLERWQKDLYRAVMRSNYETLVSLADGATSEPDGWSQIKRDKELSMTPRNGLEPPQTQTGNRQKTPGIQTGDSQESPQTQTGNSPKLPRTRSGNSPKWPQTQTGDSPKSLRTQTRDSQNPPQTQSGNSPKSPQTQTGDSPKSPQTQSGNSPKSLRTRRGNSPKSPQTQTGDSPKSLRTPTRDSQNSPQTQSGNSPKSLRTPTRDSQNSPQTQSGNSPKSLRTQTGNSPKSLWTHTGDSQNPLQTGVPSNQKPTQTPEEIEQQEEASGEDPCQSVPEETSFMEDEMPCEDASPKNVEVKQEEPELLVEDSTPSLSLEIQKCPKNELVKAKSKKKPNRCEASNLLMGNCRRGYVREWCHPCTECGKRFRLKINLIIHLRSHAKEGPYECPVCEIGFSDRRHLDLHRSIHIKDRAFGAKVWGNVHPELRIRPRRELCGGTQGLSSGGHAGGACLGQPKEEPDREGLSGSGIMRPPNPRVKCPYCKKFLSCSVSLQRHLRTHARDRPYCCSSCNKCFTRHSHLLRHQKIHERALAALQREGNTQPTAAIPASLQHTTPKAEK
ncbi:ZN783 protein, partial [Malurus elegans]|nr:ZN783 protein [Malurus elegans]